MASAPSKSAHAQRRRTPCVGICSTTYGDLVCRGCKRFAHEITGWNGYSDGQRSDVETRLQTLRAGAIDRFLQVDDSTDSVASLHRVQALIDACKQRQSDRLDDELRSAWAGRGVRIAAGFDTLEGLLRAIDDEWFSRSRGVYERSFRVSAE
ncbi:MAG: DUF1289 domain-containing protein [Pseudomonadota bacterium]